MSKVIVLSDIYTRTSIPFYGMIILVKKGRSLHRNSRTAITKNGKIQFFRLKT